MLICLTVVIGQVYHAQTISETVEQGKPSRSRQVRVPAVPAELQSVSHDRHDSVEGTNAPFVGQVLYCKLNVQRFSQKYQFFQVRFNRSHSLEERVLECIGVEHDSLRSQFRGSPDRSLHAFDRFGEDLRIDRAEIVISADWAVNRMNGHSQGITELH